MEAPSATARRRLAPFQGLLLAVSLCTFWSLPTSAKLTVMSAIAAEGKDVLLRIRNEPPDTIGFIWYQKEETNVMHYIASFTRYRRICGTGPGYSGRATVNYDGSLLLKKVTLEDTGYYTVVAYLGDSKKEIGFGRLNVYQPVRKPTLLASNTTVTENKDTVVLTCYTNGISTQWLFNGTSLWLTERMQLSPDNRILTIDPVRREDAGNYQCEVSNPISSYESVPLKLDVIYE